MFWGNMELETYGIELLKIQNLKKGNPGLVFFGTKRNGFLRAPGHINIFL